MSDDNTRRVGIVPEVGSTASGPAFPAGKLEAALTARDRAYQQQGWRAEQDRVSVGSDASGPHVPGFAAARERYRRDGFFAAGALVVFMVDEDRSAELAVAMQGRLERTHAPRLLVLDMRHLSSASTGRWWEEQTVSAVPAGSCVMAAHAPGGFALAGSGVVHHRGDGSALPGISSAYRSVLYGRPSDAVGLP